MTRAFFVAVGLLLITLTVLYAQSVQQMPAQGYLPETVTIKRSLSDTARICVEPAGGGLLSCRTVKELRAWIQDRK